MAYPATILADVLQDILECGEASLIAAGRDLPARRFVSHGQPPGELLTGDGDECSPSTLAAWCARITVPPKPQGMTGSGCSTKSIVELHLTLYRCVPTLLEDGSPPDPADLDASGKALATDGWVLWFGMLKSWGDGSLFDDLELSCSAFDPAGGGIALPPTGGLAGWDIIGRLTL